MVTPMKHNNSQDARYMQTYNNNDIHILVGTNSVLNGLEAYSTEEKLFLVLETYSTSMTNVVLDFRSESTKNQREKFQINNDDMGNIAEFQGITGDLKTKTILSSH